MNKIIEFILSLIATSIYITYILSKVFFKILKYALSGVVRAFKEGHEELDKGWKYLEDKEKK